MSGIVRWLVATTITALIVVVLFGAWLGWRLRQGPLPVPMLDPVVASALAGPDPDIRAEFSGTVLAWPEGRLPQVHVLGLRLSRADGTILADLPELSIRPSLRALLGGRLAVGTVGVTGVKLAITRDPQGRLSLAGMTPGEGGETASPLSWLTDTGDPDAPNAFLHRVTIRNAEIALDDRVSTSKWRATKANLEIRRRRNRFEADLSAELAVRFEAATLRLPLQARATATFGESSTIETVDFDATATKGGFDRGVDGRPALAIRSFAVAGGFRADGETLELRSLELGAGGATVKASGTIAGTSREAKFQGGVAAFPVGELDLAWPPGVADAARRWVLGNLRDGTITKAEFTLHHPGADRGHTIFRLNAALTGMTVDYLAPLEPVRALEASLKLDEKRLDAKVASGAVGALRLTRGTVGIDLATSPAAAAIDADLEGPTDDLLALLDSQPLGYPSRFGVPTRGVGGQTAGHVDLHFPLAGDKTAAELDVEARADLSGEGVEGTFVASVTGGELRKFEIQRYRSARNELAATIERDGDGGYRVGISGEKLDLQPLIERWRSAEKSTPSLERPFAIRFDLAKVSAASGIEWSGVRGELSGDGSRLRRAMATGTLAGGGATRITVEPAANGRRMQVNSGDAGRVFQTLGIIEKGRGGSLTLSAVTDDSGPEPHSSGTLEVSDLRVMEAPLLARILSLGSFAGISEMFRGDGMTFRRARIPFRWTDKEIRLTNARAIGAIGLTGDGTISPSTGEIDIRGEVIPAYTLNTALGKVPLIGDLLSGEGGGIFGISYEVKGTRKQPDVSVNPLSALAPSKLKEMFLKPFGL